MYLKRFCTGTVFVLVLVLTFASIFIAQADWGKQVKEKWFNVQLLVAKLGAQHCNLISEYSFIRYLRVSRLRQASQRKMIQSSALRLRLWLCQFKISLDNPAFNEEHLGFSMIIPVTAARIICLYLGHASVVACHVIFYTSHTRLNQVSEVHPEKWPKWRTWNCTPPIVAKWSPMTNMW